MTEPTSRYPVRSGLTSMFSDLSGALGGLAERRRKLMSLTTSACSDDRMITVTVGPRGQVVDLEIDPRVFRAPNSKALAAAIVATIRAAVDEVTTRTAEVVGENLHDLKLSKIGSLDMHAHT